MSNKADEERSGASCAHCLELEDELERLRRELNALRRKNEELLRRAAVRDFERPPHYQ